MTDAAELLRRVPLFARLPRASLKRLARMSTLRTFSAGSTLLEEGSVGLGLFLVTRGRVEVRKGSGDRPIVLAELGEGDILGELALIDDEPRSASAIVLETTDCLLITRDSFRTLTRKDPEIAWCIVPTLAARLRDLQQRLLAEVEDRPALGREATASPPPEDPTVSDEADEPVGRLDRPVLDLLRGQRSMAIAGLAGLQQLADLSRTVLETFADELSLDEPRPLSQLGQKLPAGFLAASRRGLIEGLRLPGRLLEELESSRRGRAR